MHVSRQRAFTIVELLVVVAIIGLMTAIIVVSLNSARTKARRAANQQLDANFHHNLGDSLVGQWLLDECSGTIAKDSSGSGYDGALNGSPVWSSDSPFGSGCSVSFDGSNYISVTGLNLRSPSVTMAAWVKPSLLTGDYQIVAKEAQYKYSMNNGRLYFHISTTGGSWNYSGAGSHALNNKSWQYVVFVVDSNALRYSLYLNGQIDRVGVMTGPITGFNSNSTYIAAWGGGVSQFVGSIDNVRIYDRALDTAAIQKLYTDEAPKHAIAIVSDPAAFPHAQGTTASFNRLVR